MQNYVSIRKIITLKKNITKNNGWKKLTKASREKASVTVYSLEQQL